MNLLFAFHNQATIRDARTNAASYNHVTTGDRITLDACALDRVSDFLTNRHQALILEVPPENDRIRDIMIDSLSGKSIYRALLFETAPGMPFLEEFRDNIDHITIRGPAPSYNFQSLFFNLSKSDTKREEPSILTLGPLTIDIGKRTIHANEKSFRVAPKPFGILLMFARNPSRTITRESALNELFDNEADEPESDRSVDSHVKHLRDALQSVGLPRNTIQPLYGSGYILNTSFFTTPTPARTPTHP